MFESVHTSVGGVASKRAGSSREAASAAETLELQRAIGAARVVFAGDATGTKVVDDFQKFPIALAFPEIDSRSHREAVVINTSGGVAGGDQIKIDVIAKCQSSIAMTTQAAEKIYRALDRPALLLTHLRADTGARLAWLPQETIVFDGARFVRKSELDLSSGSQVLALEWLVLGRAASGETLCTGHISDSWRIKLDERIIWADAFFASDRFFSQLGRRALLSDIKAFGTLIYFGPSLETRLEELRSLAIEAECKFGATIVGALLIVRMAARSGTDLKRGLRSLLNQFESAVGPGPFSVPKMWSC